MARQIRRFGPYVLVLGVLVGLSAMLIPVPREAASATFVDPWWTNDSSSPECAACSGCGCPRPPEWSPEGASYRTGDLSLRFPILTLPGMVEDLSISVLWRAEVNGRTQMGNSMVLSIENSVEKVILNQSDPESNGGHEVLWRRPDGLIVTFDWTGTYYSTSDCSIREALTKNGSGRYVLTDPWTNEILFDANGMVDKFTDRNGNEIDATYNSSYQLTGLTDARGKTFTIGHNTDGFMSYIQDPASRRWDFTYDTDGNLTDIDTPNTTDQPTGITTTINYDDDDRITGVKDGRRNEVTTYTWVGATRQIDKVTIDLDDVDFDWQTDRTDVTDRNGNVHRYHYSGQDITKKEMWIASAAKYVTTYTYSGSELVTVVFPRGNRIDYTYDGDGNMTERRHKKTNTSSTSAADLVHTWEYTDHFVISYTDPEDNETTYTRDADGNVTKVTFPLVTNPASQSADIDITYNTRGQVTQVTDEENKVKTYTYFGAGDDYGLTQKIEVDPTGLDLETTYAYDDDWNVATRTDPRGNATSYTWDSLRRLKQWQAPSPLSHKIKYEYDANGNRTKMEVENIDEDGDSYTANPWITTTYTYTVSDQLVTMVEEIDASTTRTTTFDYDDNGNHIRVTRPEGNKVKWEFNERDLVKKQIRGEGATEESTVQLVYDDNGNLTTLTDGRSNDTDHTYDLFDRRTKTEDPLGHYVEWDYDENGRVTEERRKDSSDTLLARRTYHFDERSRLWKTSDLRKDPGTTYSDAITKIERFATGHAKKVTNARNKVTEYAYDNGWRRTTVTDAMGNEWSYTLDDNGNPTSWSIEEVDGASTVTHDFEATYDALNRRLTLLEVDRTESTNKLTKTYGYDSRGNLVWFENSKGDPSRWTFDAAGRMTRKEVALATGATIEDFTSAIMTDWGFDKNNRLTSHKDDAANNTTWTYDALDRATEMKYPDLSKVTYKYDDNDNVIETVDAAGNDIDDTFDADNQMTSRSITLVTGWLGTTSETWTYDGLGRVTKAEDNDYKVEFTHAVLGLTSQVYEEKQSYVGGTAYTKTVKKTYDAVGNKITELYPSNLDLDYTWNDIDRISTVTDGTNTIASYTYVGARVRKVTFENNATASYTYSGFRQEIERIHHETSTPTTILDLQYGYDDNHDRTYERYGGTSATGDVFEYDKARRLTTAWMGSADVTAPSTNAYVEKIEYTMDDDGNRSSVKVTPYQQSSTTTSYTDNNLNQYTAIGGTSQSHDGNGNLTDNGTLTFKYNYKNLIAEVKLKSTGATVATYEYDALGRRIAKDDQTTVQRFIYSGHETVSVYDGNDTWIRDFVFGQVIDEVLMLEQADVLDYDGDSNTIETTRSYYHRNALGSVMEITDADEAVVVSYRYDPYGDVTIYRNSTEQSSDPLGNPWMYTGRFMDEESGLYYYRARAYSPETGRFLQRDPLGTTAGPNVYAYCASSPLVCTDPMGLDELYRPATAKDIEASIHASTTGGNNIVDPGAYGIPEHRSQSDATNDAADLALKPFVDLKDLVSTSTSERHTLKWDGSSNRRIVKKVHCDRKCIDGRAVCDEYRHVVIYHYEYRVASARGVGSRPPGDDEKIFRDLLGETGQVGGPAGYALTAVNAIKAAKDHPEFIRSLVVPPWGDWGSRAGRQMVIDGIYFLVTRDVKCNPALEAAGAEKIKGLAQNWCEFMKQGLK